MLAFFFPGCTCCDDPTADCNQTFEFDTLPAWTTHELTGSTNTPTFDLLAGRLRMESLAAGGTKGSFYDSFDKIDDIYLSIRSDCEVQSGTTTGTGVFLGPRVLVYNNSDIERYECDADGDPTAGPTTITSSSGSETILTITALETATNTWTFYYFADDALVDTEASISWSPGSSFNAGAWSHGGGFWDNMRISCSSPGICSYCSGATPLVRKVTFADVTNGDCGLCDTGLNRTFLLLHDFTWIDNGDPFKVWAQVYRDALSYCIWYSAERALCDPGFPVYDSLGRERVVPRVQAILHTTLGSLSVSVNQWSVPASPRTTPTLRQISYTYNNGAASPTQCLAPIVLDKYLSTLQCNNLPASVTLSPG